MGLLQHCSQVIPLSRVFLRRLIDRAYSVVELHHFIHLTLWERDDMCWWNTLFTKWNGCHFFHFIGHQQSPDIFINSDAAGSIGFGAIYNDSWFAGKWPEGSEQLSIAVKELIPIVLAADVWGSTWAGKIVEFQSDNMSVVDSLSKGFCKDRHLAFLLRDLCISAITANFSFTSSHISGVDNKLADSLSRFNFQDLLKGEGKPKQQVEVPLERLDFLVFPPWTRNGNICFQKL